MTFIRIKRVRGREYAYEMASFRDRHGEPRNRIVRYLGPISPAPPARAAILGFTAGERSKNDGRGASPQERRERKLEGREDARLAEQLRNARG